MCKCKCLTVRYLNASRLASKKPPPSPLRPCSAIRAVSFCKPLWWCCQASFCEVALAIKQQWREWLIQQWRWQYSSASIWRQPAGLEPFQTALCFSSEEKSIHNWWQFKGRLYCGISNKTSENTENKRGRTKESMWVNETVWVRKKGGDRKSNLHFALSPPCTWMVMNWLRWNEETLQRTCQQPVHVSSINGTITVPHIPLHKEATQVHTPGDCVEMNTAETTGGPGC